MALADKQIKEALATIKDLEGSIMTGTLTPDEYKAKCAARKAWHKCIEMMKTISGDEEEDSP